jgi:toxin ParE1/3/4
VREVRWSSDALDDLNGIIAYIAEDNPQAARAVIDKIETAANRLGEIATGHPSRMAGVYEKVVAGLAYIIAYAIEPRPDGSERIVILRVVHGARHWTKDEWPENEGN